MAGRLTQIGIVLAAGHGRRFGEDNKLLAELWGKPLGWYSAQAMGSLELDHKIAVVNDPSVADLFVGFDLVSLETAGNTRHADSLRAGVKRAIALDADRILVVLADMPLVTKQLMERVLGRCSNQYPSCVCLNAQPSPPACFPRARFQDLLELTGDRGAAGLLTDLPARYLVQATVDQVMDVDTPADIVFLQSQTTTPVLNE